MSVFGEIRCRFGYENKKPIKLVRIFGKATEQFIFN